MRVHELVAALSNYPDDFIVDDVEEIRVVRNVYGHLRIKD